MRETQKTVSDWGNLHYPDESQTHKLLNLFEEATELALEMDIDPSIVLNKVHQTFARAGKSGDLTGEIADVGIALYDLATILNRSVPRAINYKMSINRHRTLQQSKDRLAAKQAAEAVLAKD